MTRISLTEAYDDRSVIAKLEKMSDQVEANTETCEQAVTSAQASAESAEASKQSAEEAKAGALDAQTKANEASAKANQASASVTDKVNKTGTATPQVITGTGGLQVQGDLSVGGDLTVSESGSVHFDGSDMEVGGMAIEKSSTATVLSNEAGGIRFKGSVTVPTTATGVKTQDAVNGQRLQADLDAYAPMVRTTGNQTVGGVKTFNNGYVGYRSDWNTVLTAVEGVEPTVGQYEKFAEVTSTSTGFNSVLEFIASSNNGCEYGMLLISGATNYAPNSNVACWIVRGVGNPSNKVLYKPSLYICKKSGVDVWDLVIKKVSTYGNVRYNVKVDTQYGFTSRIEDPHFKAVYEIMNDLSQYETAYNVAMALRSDEA